MTKSKKTNENGKYTGFIVAAAVVGVLFLSFFLSGSEITLGNSTNTIANVLDDISINEYIDLKEDTDASIIYIGRPTCSYCELLKPILNEVAYTYDLDVNYLNTDDLSETEHAKLLDSDEYFAEGYGTPLVLIVKDNKIIDINEGYVEEEMLVDFFVNNEFINEDDVVIADVENEENLKNIGLNEYLELKANVENTIIYIGRPTCSYCELMKPILNKVAGSYSIPVNYLNTDNLSSDEFQSVVQSDSFFEGEWGTPSILIFNNNVLVNKLEGYVEEATLINFFKTNGFIN